jgi:hypothetical protein
MPRYRIAFAREWALGRWGYLDRFFHDLGGRESEPSGLENAWLVDYRGNARRLGRELAMALNIASGDFRKYGPIFEIEELAAPLPPETREEEPPAGTDDAARPAAEPVAASPKVTIEGAHLPPAEFPSGPTWTHAADVEDATLEGDVAAAPGEAPCAAQEAGAPAKDRGESAAPRSQTRVDDLFRIRKRSRPVGRHRADAISGATRRKPPASGSPLE